MKKYITPLILFSALSAAAPAMAHCSATSAASSTTRSCESGVTVYRGQQNGPDFRFAALDQSLKIAEARARRAQAQAQIAQRRQPQITINQNGTGGGAGFAGRSAFFTPFVQRGIGGNFNPASFIPIRSNVGGNFGGDFVSSSFTSAPVTPRTVSPVAPPPVQARPAIQGSRIAIRGGRRLR